MHPSPIKNEWRLNLMENYDSLLPVNEAPFLEGAELDWYEPRRAPFQILGLYDVMGTPYFKRLPLEVAEKTSAGVRGLNKNTSGGRIRFATDSSVFAVDFKYDAFTLRSNVPNFTVGAFDVYEEEAGREVYLGTIRFPMNSPTGYTAKLDLPGSRMRQITMYLASPTVAMWLKQSGLPGAASTMGFSPAHTSMCSSPYSARQSSSTEVVSAGSTTKLLSPSAQLP